MRYRWVFNSLATSPQMFYYPSRLATLPPPLPFCNLIVDHIVARSKGGSDHRDNLQLLCVACNAMRGARSQEALITRVITAGY